MKASRHLLHLKTIMSHTLTHIMTQKVSHTLTHTMNHTMTQTVTVHIRHAAASHLSWARYPFRLLCQRAFNGRHLIERENARARKYTAFQFGMYRYAAATCSQSANCYNPCGVYACAGYTQSHALCDVRFALFHEFLFADNHCSVACETVHSIRLPDLQAHTVPGDYRKLGSRLVGRCEQNDDNI